MIDAKTALKRKEAGGAVPLSIRRPMLPRMKQILELLQEGRYPNYTMLPAICI
jgi:hypothetical protein